jgi:phage-related protein
MKHVEFLGDSLTVLRNFPSDVRQEMGHALWELQQGQVPAIAKPFGHGIFELRDNPARVARFESRTC